MKSATLALAPEQQSSVECAIIKQFRLPYNAFDPVQVPLIILAASLSSTRDRRE